MNALRAVGEFFFDLIIGDDPKIAAAVLVALGLAGLALAAGAAATVVTVDRGGGGRGGVHREPAAGHPPMRRRTLDGTALAGCGRW